MTLRLVAIFFLLFGLVLPHKKSLRITVIIFERLKFASQSERHFRLRVLGHSLLIDLDLVFRQRLAARWRIREDGIN